MAEEARLEDVGTGLAPVTPGWFVVNAGDAAWVRNPALASRCVFESNDRVLQQRPDVQAQRFDEVGLTLSVLEPGKPSGLYHAESAQEDFLVLAGECLLVIEEQERPLRAWDFVHCPAGTNHVFVGAGDGPCVILMVGARPAGRTIDYPRSEPALAHGAGVETPTASPGRAYAPLPSWQVERPPAWAGCRGRDRRRGADGGVQLRAAPRGGVERPADRLAWHVRRPVVPTADEAVYPWRQHGWLRVPDALEPRREA